MASRTLQRLERQAMAAHKAKRHREEASLWRRIHKLIPADDRVLSNLASAEMEAGNFDEALALFDRVLRRNPKLARAHNNRAGLRLRMGADLGELFPEFLLAVELAESTEEFVWHSVNLCQSAAFGSDDGSPALFDVIGERLMFVISQRFPPHLAKRQEELFRRFIDAYREVALYRKAIAARDWNNAERQLRKAQGEFRIAGLDNFARGLARTTEDMRLVKQVFALLEDIAGEQDVGPSEAHAQALVLQPHIRSKRQEYLAGAQRRLFEVLDEFLTLFTRQLAYLGRPESQYRELDEESQTLIWLTSSSFRSMGDDLLGIVTFTEKRCRDLSSRSAYMASAAGVQRAAWDEWTRVALYVHSRVLELRDIDAALAREALGWTDDPLGRLRADVHEFRAFVERQAHTDIFVNGKPQENIARALLQAHLSGRSYREVPVRGGRSDVLVFERSGRRILFEVKTWRGSEYHEQGKRELAEYIEGENDDNMLLAAFYVVFDPTDSARALEHEGSPVSTFLRGNTTIETVIVRIRPPQPSRKRPRRR